MSQRCCHSSRWRHCPRNYGAFTHAALVLGRMSMPSSQRPCGFVATAPCPIDALHLGTGQVVLRRPRLLRLVASIALLLLHCCLRRAGALAHVALAYSSIPCRARREGPEGLMFHSPRGPPRLPCLINAVLLLPRTCYRRVAVTLSQLHRCCVAPRCPCIVV